MALLSRVLSGIKQHRDVLFSAHGLQRSYCYRVKERFDHYDPGDWTDES
jgi:hypothetical protein